MLSNVSMISPERELGRLRVLVRRIVEDEVRRILLGLPPTAGAPPICLQCRARLDGRRRHARYCTNRCRVRACRERRRRGALRSTGLRNAARTG
jgi:hypothetical protein